MDTTTIRQKLFDYIRKADDNKVKAIYAIVEGEIDQVSEWWNDKELMSELEKRSADLKNGKDEGVTWTDLKNGLKQYRR